MTKKATTRVELLQGTLDMLVLRALVFGPLHGHAIALHIERTSEDVLKVDHGSLYPAIHRLKKRGWITGNWEAMPDRNREAKYYRLTAAGKKSPGEGTLEVAAARARHRPRDGTHLENEKAKVKRQK